jgi:16S rRNA (cytidine1402-2'-O)-methyltransferase
MKRRRRHELLDRSAALRALGNRGVGELLDALEPVAAALALILVQRHPDSLLGIRWRRRGAGTQSSMLYVVATPIGNLEDITFRAVRTLGEVDLIAAEDTRRTAKLLSHYRISRPMVSLREHNEHRETPKLVARLAAGAAVALVSDAGTPGISDPGTRLVRATRDAGIRVVPIPGPSAVVAALSASGYPADRFRFLGFPPATGQARTEWFRVLAREADTVVFFEAPHRIKRTLSDLATWLVNRPYTCVREVTKLHEELVDRPISEAVIPAIGEFTVVIGQSDQIPESEDELAGAVEMVDYLTNNLSTDTQLAIQRAATAFGVTERTLRKRHKLARYRREP